MTARRALSRKNGERGTARGAAPCTHAVAHPCTPAHRQEGAALVVALILVLVSTLLGVSVMESSTIEVRLASNEEFRESVFRTAEAASDTALDSLDVTALLASGGSAPSTLTSIDTRVSVSGTQRIEGLAHVVGTSFGAFQNYLVSSSATAGITALGAERTVTQGESVRVLAGGN